MFAVIGLGNPGARYARTRHNAGFLVLDTLCEHVGVSVPWRVNAGILTTDVRIGGEKVMLVKPQKYMNRSGEVSAPEIRYHRLELDHVIVVHDDLDLAAGQLRLRLGGATGGHRGLEDLVLHLGSSDFVRVRIGIGHPRSVAEAGGPTWDVSNWVLSEPGEEEWVLFRLAIKQAADAVECIVKHGLSTAQNSFNRNKGITEKKRRCLIWI